MWMRHNWQRKGFGPHLAAGTAERGFGEMGVRVAGRGDGWVLGEKGGALVLVQAMPISNEESHVMVVAAANDEASVALCDQVADYVRRSVRFD